MRTNTRLVFTDRTSDASAPSGTLSGYGVSGYSDSKAASDSPDVSPRRALGDISYCKARLRSELGTATACLEDTGLKDVLHDAGRLLTATWTEASSPTSTSTLTTAFFAAITSSHHTRPERPVATRRVLTGAHVMGSRWRRKAHLWSWAVEVCNVQPGPRTW